MAVKSVVDIEVNDASFKKYQDAFQKYQDLLRKQPDAWKKITAEQLAAMKALSEHEAIQKKIFTLVKQTGEEEKKAAPSIEKTQKAWKNIEQSTRNFATHIKDATVQLLKWAGVTTAISGLLGAGGLFGISRLATSAASQRRDASGLGISAGQSNAFRINYGPLVNTGSVLGGVNDALTDVTKRGNLFRVPGITESSISGKNAAEVSAMLIDQIKKLVDATPREQLGNVHSARGLGALGFSVEDLQRIRDRSSGEIGRYHQGFDKDKGSLDISDKQLSAWEKFKQQLDRAGTSIENAFIKVLTPLTPELTKLSAAFVKLVQALLGGEAGKSLVNAIAEGLKSLADVIGKPEFAASITKFGEDVVKVAKAVARALGHLARWVTGDDEKKKDGGTPETPAEERKRVFEKLDENVKKTDKFIDAITGTRDKSETDKSGIGKTPTFLGPGAAAQQAKEFVDWLKRLWPSSSSSSTPSSTGDAAEQLFKALSGGGSGGSGGARLIPAAFRPLGSGGYTPGGGGGGGGSPGGGQLSGRPGQFASLESSYGLPSGLIDTVWNIESGRGRNFGHHAAQGHFQFMPGTWARYGGGGDPKDLGQSSAAAAHYLSDLMRRFGGDTRKALAGYNWGEGNVEKAVAKWGERWLEHAPKETQNYIRRAFGGGDGSPGGGTTTPGRSGGLWATININNNTGGNAIVTASMLPA